MQNKCGCGKTKNSAGLCDGSHNNKPSKATPYTQITIRCISTKGEPQRTKNLLATVANNTQLMKTMGFAISDPLYDQKMAAFKERRPFIENGQASKPVKEAFAPSEKKEEAAEKVKSDSDKPEAKVRDDGRPEILVEEKVKRVRRTKAQIEADKAKETQKTVTA